jgi:hypothetical protein
VTADQDTGITTRQTSMRLFWIEAEPPLCAATLPAACGTTPRTAQNAAPSAWALDPGRLGAFIRESDEWTVCHDIWHSKTQPN